MKRLLILLVFFIVGCSSNSNMSLELSGGKSNLVDGVKVYAGYSFQIFKIEVDGVEYLVNSKGGIISLAN